MYNEFDQAEPQDERGRAPHPHLTVKGWLYVAALVVGLIVGLFIDWGWAARVVLTLWLLIFYIA